MKRSSIGHLPCSIARALDVVGEWWTPVILRQIFHGQRRFEQIHDRTGISRNILTDRLGTLVAAGILDQRPYQARPARYEYHLTERGQELLPTLVALMQWGDKWLPDERGPFALAVHHEPEHRVRAVLVCPECGEVPADEVHFEPGPAAPPESVSLEN